MKGSNRILEAGRWVPSGENHQSWHLILIRDRETRREICRMASIAIGAFATIEYSMGRMSQLDLIEAPSDREKVAKLLYSGAVAAFLKEAPLLIVVAGGCKALDMPYDLSACAENMLLEAHSLGLGGCWVNAAVASPRAEMKMKELLDIPLSMTEYKVLMILSFGWPRGRRAHPKSRRAIHEFVSLEKFGRRKSPESAT